MKVTPKLFLIALVALVWVATGCGDGSSDSGTAVDEHAGHDHGQVPAEPAAHGGGDWCAEHDVAEALCWVCNPDVIPAYKSTGDWCAGHGLPESRCLDCNPGLAEAGPASAADGGHDHKKPRYMKAPTVTCTKNLLTVNFERETIAEEAGLEFAEVRIAPVTRTLECNAILEYDGNRFARLAPQIGGLVQSVAKDLGDQVVKGDVLAVIVSPAFGAAKAAYLQAVAAEALWQKNHAREKDLLSRGVATERDLLEAETSLAESRIARSRTEQELMGLGLTSEQIAQVARGRDTTYQYQVIAPFAGVVVERQASVGELSSPSAPLFAVADISRIWALLDVYETDIQDIKPGQSVVLHVEGLEGDPVGGETTWVSTNLDPRTRTLQARAVLHNPDGVLRANMFARAVVTVREAKPTVVVPRAAVQWEGCCNVVFVKESNTTFRPTKVHLGPTTGSMVEVRRGLVGGETVVTQGSFLLKTEILKGNIGAGCCEAQPGSQEG